MRVLAHLALLLLLALAGVGCARLEAKVYTFDMQGYKDYKQTKMNYAAMQAVVYKLESEAGGTYKPEYKTLKGAIKRTGVYLASVETSTPGNGLLRLLTIQGNHGTAATNAASSQSALSEAVAKSGSGASTLPAVEKAQEKDKAKDKKNGVTDLATLEEASEYVYAPAVFWKRESNEASAYAAYGNIDIAIRMQEATDYSLKSMRVDSSELISNTIALTKQLVSSVAAIYGLPTNFSTGENTSSEFSIATDIAGIEAITAASNADRLKRETAQDELLATMQRLADDLASGDDTKFAAAIKGVQDAFTDQKDTLSK